MYKRKKVGVVILNFKDADTTILLCNKIANYSVIDKIVIVDNLSPDNSFEKLKTLKNNKIDIIQSEKNGGYSYGNNFGAFYLIERYRVDVLFIANPDVIFSEEFLIGSIDSLYNENIQAISGVMLDGKGKEMPFSGKIHSYIEDLLGCTILIKRIFKPTRKEKLKKEKNLIYCEMLPGSLFGIDAKVFKEICGLDENVFLFCEERILGTKLKQLNYKIAINTDISFYHLHSVSINKSLKKIKQIEQLYKSRLYFNSTYRELSLTKKIIMKIFMYYGIYIRKILYTLAY